MVAALEAIEFDSPRMRAALTDDVLATEVADAMVARGVLFRDAHAAVARAVATARAAGKGLRQLTAAELPEPLELRDLERVGFEAAVERRGVEGGSARAALEAQLEAAHATLETP